MLDYQSILNDDALIAKRDRWIERLDRLGHGEHEQSVFLLNGIDVCGSCDLYEEPEKWVEQALEMAAEKAAKFDDEVVFRPITISFSPYGVHFVNVLFGARAYQADPEQGCWWADYIDTQIGQLKEPDIEEHPCWKLYQRVAQAFNRADIRLPYFETPVLSSPLNIILNLYGQAFLEAMLCEPEGARHDLRIVTDTIVRLHRLSQDLIPKANFQPPLACGRIQPSGHGQICGCSCQLLSKAQYDEFIAPLDDEVLSLYPGGGLIHLCGSHSQHIPTWRSMKSVKAVQVNNRAAEDLELYFESLRDDQLIYVDPCPEMEIPRIMEITGGHRTVIVWKLDEPLMIQ